MKINVSEKIAESLITIGVVPSEEKELYKYGIRQGILMVINVLTAILIGFILGMVWQSMAFMLTYIPIRTYAGGYHASTQLRCYLSSTALMAAVLIAIKLIPWNGCICSFISFCAGMVIFWLAPVEDLNKPLKQIEKTIYKRRTWIILVLLLGVAFLFWFAGSKQISISIIMALDVVAVLLILGAIKNSRYKNGKCRRLNA